MQGVDSDKIRIFVEVDGADVCYASLSQLLPIDEELTDRQIFFSTFLPPNNTPLHVGFETGPIPEFLHTVHTVEDEEEIEDEEDGA